MLISPLLSFGHNPLSARYHFEAGENASLLTINLSQDGVNNFLSKKFDREELSNFSGKELEIIIVEYIKDNFSMSAEGKKIELDKGGIKLGNHQTDLKFVLPPFSNSVDDFDIDISAFKENSNHQTIFSYKIFEKNDHVILSNLNDYKSTVSLSSIQQSSSSFSYAFILGGIGILVLLAFGFMRKQSLKPQTI